MRSHYIMLSNSGFPDSTIKHFLDVLVVALLL
jgi:hypothetical protein